MTIANQLSSRKKNQRVYAKCREYTIESIRYNYGGQFFNSEGIQHVKSYTLNYPIADRDSILPLIRLTTWYLQ